MHLSQNALDIKSLNLILIVVISLVVGVSPDLTESSDEPCILKMTLQNFRSILSWEVKNHSIVPTHYTLFYTVMSKKEDMKAVENCTDTKRSFCDLTGVWKNIHETYITLVEAFRGNMSLVNCTTSFLLAVDMSFEPPEFEIVAFKDHINVLVKFLPMTEEGWQFVLSLIIEEESEGVVKKHKPQIKENISGSITYVIDKLIPNTNYCVSVYFESEVQDTVIKSPVKCTFLHLSQESDPSESAKIGGIVILFLMAAFLTSTIVILKRIGYICLRNNIPKALNFHNFSAWIPKLPPWEAMDLVEVISINRKKKVWDYNYDDSDSDNEASHRTSGGGYTMHGLTGRPLSQASASSAASVQSQLTDPDFSEQPDLPEADVEPPMIPAHSPWQLEHVSEPCERESPLQDPFSEDSSSTEQSGDRIIFNVDLNSVLMRVLDDDDNNDSDNSEEDPLMLSLPEETVDPEDPHRRESDLLLASGEGTQPTCPSPSSGCLWPEDVQSDKSDAAESDVDIGDGYVMR